MGNNRNQLSNRVRGEMRKLEELSETHHKQQEARTAKMKELPGDNAAQPRRC